MGTDLRSLIRNNASDKEITSVIMNLIANKPARHSFGGTDKRQDHKTKEMFRIGG